MDFICKIKIIPFPKDYDIINFIPYHIFKRLEFFNITSLKTFLKRASYQKLLGMWYDQNLE